MEIDRSSSDGNNQGFCIKVNHTPIFVLGTNWVPLDVFHSRDPQRLGQALELLDEIQCNMVRCWGGNVYESQEFFVLQTKRESWFGRFCDGLRFLSAR